MQTQDTSGTPMKEKEEMSIEEKLEKFKLIRAKEKIENS